MCRHAAARIASAARRRSPRGDETRRPRALRAHGSRRTAAPARTHPLGQRRPRTGPPRSRPPRRRLAPPPHPRPQAPARASNPRHAAAAGCRRAHHAAAARCRHAHHPAARFRRAVAGAGPHQLAAATQPPTPTQADPDAAPRAPGARHAAPRTSCTYSACPSPTNAAPAAPLHPPPGADPTRRQRKAAAITAAARRPHRGSPRVRLRIRLTEGERAGRVETEITRRAESALPARCPGTTARSSRHSSPEYPPAARRSSPPDRAP